MSTIINPILSPFDARVLTGVINNRPLKSDVFTSFFKKRPASNSELFELHVKTRKTSMLPAISNHAQGTMRKSDTLTLSSVKAPRFRSKRLFSASDRFKQSAGFTPYAPLEDTVGRAIAEDMDLHREEIDLAIEIMCQQAMVNGKITLYNKIDGSTTPQFTVDFKRPDTNKVTLAGDSLWSAANSDLLGQIEEWDLKIQEETGYGASDLLLGKNAWLHFRNHKDVKDYFDNRSIDAGSFSLSVGRKIKGYWNNLTIWAIAGDYIDLDGSTNPYLDEDTALLVTRDAESVIEFGLPVDNECFDPCEFFAKSYKQDDPSGIFTIAESRPLAWTKQPGWTVLAKVV